MNSTRVTTWKRLRRVTKLVDAFGSTLIPEYWKIPVLLRRLADSGESLAEQ